MVLRADQLPAVGPEIAYIIQDSGAKAVVSHERYAEVISAAAEEAGCPPWPGSPTGRCPGFRDVEAALAEQPTLPEDRPPGAAMHYTSGTTGKPKGVKRKLADFDPDVMAELFTGFLRPVRHPPPRRPGAPLHLAELPHGRHDLRGQRAQLGHRVVFMDKWDPEETLEQIRAVHGHHTHMVPDPVPPDAAAPRRREGRLRRVVDAVGDPRRRRRARST